MAEDTKPVQGTLQFADINLTLRYDSVGEMVSAFEEIAKAGDELTTSLTTIKQAYLGKSVMTGTHTAGTATTATVTRSTPPPSGATTGGVPSGSNGVCKHNLPWKDTRFPDGTSGRTKAGETMKYDLYCIFESDNWKDRCQGIALNPR